MAPSPKFETVAEALAENKHLESFGSWLERAGLTTALDNKKFTLFVPHNVAFNKLSDEDLKALNDDEATLDKVVMRHIIPGKKVTHKKVAWNEKRYPNMNREMLKILGKEDKKMTITFRDKRANRYDDDDFPDIMVKNGGIIHIIDTVLGNKLRYVFIKYLEMYIRFFYTDSLIILN